MKPMPNTDNESQNLTKKRTTIILLNLTLRFAKPKLPLACHWLCSLLILEDTELKDIPPICHVGLISNLKYTSG